MTDHQHPSRCEFEIDKLIIQLDAVIPSDSGVIESTTARIVRLIEKLGCWDDAEAIDLALREALANAIIHGNRSDSAKSVRICVGVELGCNVLIIVKDEGPGFDPSQLPNPVIGQNVFMAHGRGIFLINHLMENVNFRFDHGTAIYMRRKLSPRSTLERRRW
jgi:anti-sigma regulatory factor (Ser/Thr protein kinase)